jgi:RNA polymerase sigma factor (sigma-70 family)
VPKALLNPALQTALHALRRRLAPEPPGAGTDAALLDRFFNGREAEAFELLLRRHGPMVLGVCRRVLGDVQDAEDAFQATFLILLRKGQSFVPRGKLANWLYTVARHVALRARAARARRRDCERRAMLEKPAGVALDPGGRRELRAVLDEELSRLPEKDRAPLVLCYLEGLTQEAAARELGWPVGTVSSRLARARERLRGRLGRRGLALPAGLLGVLATGELAPAVPPALLAAAGQTARAFLAGNLAAGGLSAAALSLSKGAIRAMWLMKLRAGLGLVVAVAALAGSGLLAVSALGGHDHPAHPGDPVRQEEHTALFELVSDCDATHMAVADGAWGDPRTWDKRIVPGAGARVVIPAGRTVTVAARHDRERLDWLRVDGTLRFDPAADTALKVVTLVGNVKSTIEVGTEKERVRADRTARLVLGDRGRRDDAQRRRDPYDLGGGLLSHGRVRIFGTEYTSHATPTAVPRKGDTEVRFARAPRGWKVGDTLLFAGLDRQLEGRDVGVDPWTDRRMPVGRHQDEERTIRALSGGGSSVTLDRPLAYQHGGIYGYPEAVPVGNLSRNVVVESENVKDASRRGHVMFMHTQDVVIDSALFRELGRTSVEGEQTSPRVTGGKLEPGTDANSIGRYALHFHIRWGATCKQRPFVVRNSAVVGSPKLGVVNHGGYGLVDDNVSYRVRGSHFFTENGSEIGRFKGNLAVRSHGTGGDDDGVPIPRKYAYDHPLNIGHGGHGFWLQGGGVDVLDNVAVGHSYSAFGFFVANNRIVTYGGPQEPHNPLTKGTRWERLDVFLAENLKDRSLAHGNRFLHTSAVPFHMARCVGLASQIGLRTRGIDRTEFLVLHDRQDLIEDCRFVWNEQGYLLGYSPGLSHLRNTQFIGSDPAGGGLPRAGIGDGNHIPGFLTLENVTIDGYRTGCVLPARGVHVIKGGLLSGIRKLVVPTPWGGKVVVEGVKFGHMKGEEPEPILFGADPRGPHLYGVPPYTNWTRKFQPFELVYNGRQVYHDDQKPNAVPFDLRDRRWADSHYGTPDHGPLAGKTGRQLWEQYRLAVGGRLAPAGLTPCPDIKGGSFGPDVPFDPPVESEPSTAYYGGKRYEQLFGPSQPDGVHLHARYLYDPILAQTPQKGYVAHVRIAGKDYQSEPTNLVRGVNVVPVRTGRLTRYVVVGAPTMVRPYKRDEPGAAGE